MDQLNEVVKYILYKSRENNTPVTEIMATFIAQVIYNPRTQRFYLEDRLSESELRELKEEAIKKIAGRDSAQMKTIELQITYDTEFLEAELRKQQRTR